MLKSFTKLILTIKAAGDVIKEKAETKACNLAVQLKAFKEGKENITTTFTGTKSNIKEKAKEELLKLVSEISHKAQLNEVQLRGFIKEKLCDLTNEALLDSMELNDIRAEIASLRAEVQDLKAELQLQKK